MQLDEALKIMDIILPYATENGGGSDGSKPLPCFNVQVNVSTASNGDRWASVTVTENFQARKVEWAGMLSEVEDHYPGCQVRLSTFHGQAVCSIAT